MIKILILIAITALTTAIGVLLSANKKKKMQVFTELYEFNSQMLVNMKFERNSVEKVAKNFRYIPDILRGEAVLNGKDGEFLAEYVHSLGRSDPLSQIDYLNDRKAALSKYRDESVQDYKRYSSLYIKIFFMIGVLMAVLLA